WCWHRPRRSSAPNCSRKPSPKPSPIRLALPMKPALSSGCATTFTSYTARSAISRSPSLPIWNLPASISTWNAPRPTKHEYAQNPSSRRQAFEFKDEIGQKAGSGSRAAGRLRMSGFRCGIGYDLHRLAEGRPLVVGGITLPFDKGPVGHSDGDVLAHALCDALLGAAGLGDIGAHFPDTDPKWRGAKSLAFLEHARKLLDERGLKIEHVDAVVIMERPKLGPHFPQMREALAKSLRVTPETIHLKAKTNEGVDAIGR